MSGPTNDIDALAAFLMTASYGDDPWADPDNAKDWSRALTALVAEREKLVEDNASQTYKGNSVRYWHDKACAYKATIWSVWEILGSAAVHPDGERTITAALTALVAERDGLKQRVAELAQPPAMRPSDDCEMTALECNARCKALSAERDDLKRQVAEAWRLYSVELFRRRDAELAKFAPEWGAEYLGRDCLPQKEGGGA